MGGHLLHGGLYSSLILLQEIQTKLGQRCQLLHEAPPSFLLLLKERQTGLGERPGGLLIPTLGVLYSFLPLLKESDPSERNTNRDRREIESGVPDAGTQLGGGRSLHGDGHDHGERWLAPATRGSHTGL